MTVESAKMFLDKLGSDAAFAEKLKKADNREESRKIINDAGFTFTEEELAEAQQGELKDDELDAVAGGGYLCVKDTCGMN